MPENSRDKSSGISEAKADSSGSKSTRLRFSRIYVYLHIVAALCTCVFGLEYLLFGWIPYAIAWLIAWIAIISFYPFVLTAPIMILLMLAVWSRDQREFVYLGVCDGALLFLQVFSMEIGCM